MRSSSLAPIRGLTLVLLASIAACGTTPELRDPLAHPSAAPQRVDSKDAAARQLDLQAASTEIQARLSELHRNSGWQERGYFTTSEHDAIEWLLFRFVHNHRAFWGEIDHLGGVELALAAESGRPAAHVLVLHAGLALADSSSFLVMEFQDDPVAIAKLNEAFYRTEIVEGTYDRLRLAVTSPERRQELAAAWDHHESELARPDGSLISQAAGDPELSPVLAALPPLHDRVQERLASLRGPHAVAARLDHSRAAGAIRTSDDSLSDLGYATRALVFKNVSRIKSPAAHLIRFSDADKRELHDLLRPGDVILTYTAGYVSDVFIPGAFKHGMTYVGGADERTAAGLTPASTPVLARSRADRFAADLARDRMPDGSSADLIEAVAEGVKFSNLDQILDTHVNRLLVLRPQLEDGDRTTFLAGVFAFVGDPYDFRFDFADATRQVCTEVIYRALNGKAGIDFALTTRAGHPTLSADDVVLYHFANPGRFELVAFAEEDLEGSDHAARLWTGDPAERHLKERMASEK